MGRLVAALVAVQTAVTVAFYLTSVVLNFYPLLFKVFLD
jgi:hypothetical protein